MQYRFQEYKRPSDRIIALQNRDKNSALLSKQKAELVEMLESLKILEINLAKTLAGQKKRNSLILAEINGMKNKLDKDAQAIEKLQMPHQNHLNSIDLDPAPLLQQSSKLVTTNKDLRNLKARMLRVQTIQRITINIPRKKKMNIYSLLEKENSQLKEYIGIYRDYQRCLVHVNK